ncbi:unnamed protein product, partial [Iphiclides podalirius]
MILNWPQLKAVCFFIDFLSCKSSGRAALLHQKKQHLNSSRTSKTKFDFQKCPETGTIVAVEAVVPDMAAMDLSLEVVVVEEVDLVIVVVDLEVARKNFLVDKTCVDRIGTRCLFNRSIKTSTIHPQKF